MKEQLQRVANFFKLGEIENNPSKLHGGDLNTNWKVKTKNGSFVIKQLNPKISLKKNICEIYQRTEDIAKEFADRAIPAIVGIRANNHSLFKSSDGIFLAFPFIEGIVFDAQDLSNQQCSTMAQLFYKLHHSQVPTKNQDNSAFQIPTISDWENLLIKTNHSILKELIPFLERSTLRFNQSKALLQSEQVLSHCDLHPANVLWDENTPNIIDWECAGSVNPIQETVGYFLEWSGIMSSRFEQNNFATMMHVYFNKPNRFLTPLETGFFGWLGLSPILWTYFNIERSLDKNQSAVERAKGNNLYESQLLPALTYIRNNEKHILDCCAKYFN